MKCIVLALGLALPGCAEMSRSGPDTVDLAIENLLLDPGTFDGRRVRVEAYFLVSRESSVLTDRLLESYPPQAGSPNVWIEARSPAGDCLDEGKGMAAGTAWGTVVATGTFRHQPEGGLGHLGAWTMALEEASLACP